MKIAGGTLLLAVAAWLATLPQIGGIVVFAIPALAVGAGLLASAALDALGADR